MIDDFIKTGVIGHPISHSKSPLIHGYWLEKYGISGSYEAIDISPSNIKQGVQYLIDSGYYGFNVTVPHKISIMSLCDEIDDTARAIGAVNTVTIRGGELYGFNTDAYGFIKNIKSNAAGFDFTTGKAVILGAGGAAKAIIYALLQEGVGEITITNRTKEKAIKLAEFDTDKITVIDWDDRNNIFDNVNLIVNTTALGMVGKPPLDINISGAPKHALVTDIVYAPLYTDLLKQAQHLDLNVVTGIGMLIHQARPAFEKWNGHLPEVTDELEKLVLS